MPALLRAEQVPRPADLEIAHRDLEPGAELRRLEDRLQPLLRRLGQRAATVVQQIGVRADGPAAYAPPELVELREPQTVGLIDDDGVHVRDVQARLDDGRAYKDVGLSGDEPQHRAFELLLRHLTVRDEHVRLGHEIADLARHLLDVLHPVVYEVHLPAALDLANDGLADHTLVELGYIRLDGQAVLGRGLDGGHVPNPAEGHVQRPRDGRRCEGQHVDLAAHLLEPFLVRHAEPLLFVDDDEAEVLEPYVLLEQPVRPDDDVDGAVGEPLHDLALLAFRPEAAQHLDANGKRREPARKRLEVLLGEDGRRHQHRHLRAVGDGLERRAHRDLRLPVAHVAAHQAVHRLRPLHVELDLSERGELVGRLDVRERSLELLLPRRVR